MPELSELRVLDEEERTVLNPARTEVGNDVRQRLWKAFAEERRRQIDADCGNIENVRRLVGRSEHVERSTAAAIAHHRV